MRSQEQTLYTLAVAGLLSDVAWALHTRRFELARVLSEAHWCVAHAGLYRARGYLDGAYHAMTRARMLLCEAEALVSDNAVTSDPPHREYSAPSADDMASAYVQARLRAA